MPTSPITRWSGNRLQPLVESARALPKAVTLAPGSYKTGQVLGQITSSNTNDVQTLTMGGTITGGTIALSIALQGLAQSTAAIAYNATAATFVANIQAALDAAYGAGLFVVAGTGPFTITAATAKGLGGRPLPAFSVANNLTGTSPTAVLAHTTPGVGPQFSYAAYASGNSDGSQVAVGLLEYACYVDSFANVTVGDPTTGVTTGGEFGQSDLSNVMYESGDFAIEDLVGLDATAATSLNAHVVAGTIASGTGQIHIG